MEKQSFERIDPTIEEESFKDYVFDLNLKPEDFNKVILDVGAGQAHFAKYAKDHDISSQIYSLEPFEEMSVKEKTLVALAENIPMPDKSFDLIVSNGAIPNIYLGDKNINQKIEQCFSEMLRVLKDGGEIRLARVLIGDKYENQTNYKNVLTEVLKKIESENVDVKQKRTPMNDAYEYENHKKKDLLAESFLITIKKLGKAEDPNVVN